MRFLLLWGEQSLGLLAFYYLGVRGNGRLRFLAVVPGYIFGLYYHVVRLHRVLRLPHLLSLFQLDPPVRLLFYCLDILNIHLQGAFHILPVIRALHTSLGQALVINESESGDPLVEHAGSGASNALSETVHHLCLEAFAH
jgi:hypothetical protein